MRTERVVGRAVLGFALSLCMVSLCMVMPLLAGPNALIAVPGPDRRVAPGRVTLDGRASHHPNNAPLSYQWSFTGGPTPARLSNDAAASPSVDLTTPGTYTFGLRVYDAYRTSTMSEVMISVDDLPPSCSAGQDRLVPTGPVNLTGFAQDANNQPLRVTWVQVKGPKPAQLADPNALSTRFVAAVDATGIYEFVLEASDGTHTTRSAPVKIEVDDPPTCEAFANPAHVDPGQKADLNGAAASDPNPEDNPLIYAWTVESGPEKVALTGADQQFARFAARRAGDYTIKLTVTSRTNPRKAEGTCTVAVKNVAPVAQVAAAQPSHREEVELDGSASSDENGDPLTYEWKQVGGNELSFADAGTARPKVTAAKPGTYKVQLVVKDGELESNPVTTSVSFKNTPPVPLVQALITCAPGPVFLNAAASVDADGDAVRYAWRQVAGPRVRIDGPFSYRPRVWMVEPGPYVFELQVNDGVAYSNPVRVNVNVVR